MAPAATLPDASNVAELPFASPIVKRRSVLGPRASVLSVPPPKTKFEAVAAAAPIELLLPPLAMRRCEQCHRRSSSRLCRCLLPDSASVPAPAFRRPVAVVSRMTPEYSYQSLRSPSLIAKVRVIPVVALVLRLIFPFIVAVPLFVASNVIPTPLVVVFENATLTPVDPDGIVAPPCICSVDPVLPASVNVVWRRY